MRKISIKLGLGLLLLMVISANGFAECEGDFDGDRDLDGDDLVQIVGEFGRTDCQPGTPCRADIFPVSTPDGNVNELDLAVFLDDFGRSDCPEKPRTPLNLFNIGNSIGEGIAAYGDINASHHETVWSTGFDPTDVVYTLNERFQDIDPQGYYANTASRDQTFNQAASGDEVGDFVDQANAIIAAANATPTGTVDMVTVFLGNNDVCTDRVDNMTKLGNFEERYRNGLNILASSDITKNAHIHVSGIPAIYWLWIAKRSDPWCRIVWLGVPCKELLANPNNDCADGGSDLDPDTIYPDDGDDCIRRKNFHAAIRDDYNRILRDVLAEYQQDGRLPNAYYIDIFDIQFDNDHVNSGDCFHPSDEGHAVLAEAHWCRSPWGAGDPACAP